MSLWSFRFLLWYICILFVQPQNRFTFLYSLHIADIAIIASLALHAAASMQEKRPIVRLGPATVTALILLAAGFTSLYAGLYQPHAGWNGYIDQLAKSALVLIMVEAMATSVERVWAVLATMMLASLWWIKAGLRLSQAGAFYSGERLMGPASSIVNDPNGFAVMLAVMIPVYLYFQQQSTSRSIRWLFLAIALSAVYIAMETGSRTGIIMLVLLGVLLFLKYGREHKFALLVGGVALFFIVGLISPANIERFRTVPESFMAFVRGEEKPISMLSQDEHSAVERRAKNRDTWALIKAYPLFGVGINADEARYRDRFPMAGGQVHCEILMAGRQMGIVGMSLYVALLTVAWVHARRIERHAALSWKDVSNIGWTIKTQILVIAIGGFFLPLPWNAVMLTIVGLSSSLWAILQQAEVAGRAEQPAPSLAAVSAPPAHIRFSAPITDNR